MSKRKQSRLTWKAWKKMATNNINDPYQNINDIHRALNSLSNSQLNQVNVHKDNSYFFSKNLPISPTAPLRKVPDGTLVRAKFSSGAVKTGDYLNVIDFDKISATYHLHFQFPDGSGGYRVRVPRESFTVVPGGKKPEQLVKKVSFESVILSGEKKDSILEAIGQLDNHNLIFNKWGFSQTMEKGMAVSLLFYGIPGTGKTLMAQAIADHLGKKLLTISTAEIESSEPGGAERAIKAFFETAKDDTILLFDECDSLIYDRQYVGSILAAQVNQLLTSLEHYKGVAIFTTNRLGTLDEAFNRRLSLKVEFEIPTLQQRIQIWQRMFPKQAPLHSDVNFNTLARLEITGGYIKNVVLRAARMAAMTKHQTINQAILVKALRSEVTAMMDFEDARTKVRPINQRGYTIRKG